MNKFGILLFFLLGALSRQGLSQNDRASERAIGTSAETAALSLACALERPESFPKAADATVKVTVSGAPPPYQCTWNGGAQGANGSKSNIACNPFNISGLTAGGAANGLTYTLTVTAGGMSATCTVVVQQGTVPAPPSCLDFLQNQRCRDEMVRQLQTALTPPAQSICKQWEGQSCGTTTFIHHNGPVGIGTANVPPGFRLAVKGGVVTNNVKINLCKNNGWCDYVFAPNYPLMPLADMQRYIAHNRSLPRTHTQAQITEEGGYELRGVALEHQEKIEEAFLHLIRLGEQVEALRQKVAALRLENERLKQ